MGAMGTFLLCCLRWSEIQLGLMGVGPEDEEETGVEGRTTAVDMGKCVETLGGSMEKGTDTPTLMGLRVTTREEAMWAEGIYKTREEMLRDRSVREEKMEEEGEGKEEDGGEDTTKGVIV